jgi:hypothetical protein
MTYRQLFRATALAIAVILAVAVGPASSAVGSTDQPLKESGGPRLSGLREAPDPATGPGPHLSGLRGKQDAAAAPSAATTPSEEGGFPWAAAAIGSVAVLGLIGLAISRARSRTRTGPAALSQ